jgi:tetratricopeptide (TPR) repeat protein
LTNNSLEDISHWKTRIAVGRMAFDAGLYSQAIRHFRSALKLLRHDTANSELISINLICLAKALSCSDQCNEAQKLAEEALQIDIVSADNLLQLVRDYLELASISWKQHRIEQAESYGRKVLDLFNTLDIKDRCAHAQSIARAYKLLAIIKGENKNYDEGLKLIDKGLGILENVSQGIKSEAYGEALMVKVMLLIDKGEVEQVQSILEEAIELVELHKGLFHPQLIKTMGVIIEHMKRSGRQLINKELLDQFEKNNELFHS